MRLDQMNEFARAAFATLLCFGFFSFSLVWFFAKIETVRIAQVSAENVSVYGPTNCKNVVQKPETAARTSASKRSGD